jgi:transposase-like protein
MGERWKFSAESKREAVAMLDAPGVTVSQIAAELGIGVNVLGRWRRKLRQETKPVPICRNHVHFFTK